MKKHSVLPLNLAEKRIVIKVRVKEVNRRLIREKLLHSRFFAS